MVHAMNFNGGKSLDTGLVLAQGAIELNQPAEAHPNNFDCKK